MAKQLNVALNFTANTAQASSTISSLSAQLSQLAHGTDLKINTTGMKEASMAAKELAVHLNKAYDASTGNLDLNKFNNSLNATKTNVGDLSKSLLKGGEVGKQAFLNLSTSISNAEQPMVRVNNLFTEMWTTMKNTLRWQISSSVLHGLTGALQSAFGYAKGLDKSLNDIRIVSGLNADEMERFAEKANKSAQALSTTTKKYSDAALIFYQQGLGDKEVQERTDATIKMANVTEEAVEDVSSYMTAVWNNFNKDGDQAVEHYGDIMTKLGADTAASTEEIAGGLEKFAGIADTIGLSFEYATSAITTIVDRTRQSEDVVGTALKTMFSRLEGLKLGETLDDGTDLNKYSEALAKANVYIKDANGGLRDMDDIMDDIGEVWEKLDRDQQVALAQAVAGIRQYNQFMTLFDNWDVMEKNLEIAYNAEGSLNEQAETYAESWEAARNRVRAALEDVYQDLINSKTFISLNDGIAEAISGIDDFIERIGGIKPVIITLGALILSLNKDKIDPAIQQMIQNIKISTVGVGKTYESISSQLREANTAVKASLTSDVEKQQLDNNTQLLEVKTKLSMVNKKLTSDERAAAEIAIEGIKAQQNEVLTLTQELEEQKKVKQESIELFKNNKDAEELNAKNIVNAHSNVGSRVNTLENRMFREEDKTNGDLAFIERTGDKIRELRAFYLDFETVGIQAYQALSEGYANYIDGVEQGNITVKDSFGKIIDIIGNLTFAYNEGRLGPGDVKAVIQDVTNVLPSAITETEKYKNIIQELNLALVTPGKTGAQQTMNSLSKLQQILETSEIKANQFGEALKSIASTQTGKTIDSITEALEILKEKEEEVTQKTKGLNDAVKGFNPSHTITRIEALASGVSMMGSASMGIMSFKSAIDTFNDTDISGIEKLSSVLMSGSMFGSSAISLGREIAPIGGRIKETYQHFNAPNKAAQQVDAWKKMINKNGARAADAYINPRIFVRQAASLGQVSEETVKLTMEQAKAVKSGSALTATIKSLASSFAAFIGPVAAVIAILGALTLAIYGAYKANHKYREGFEDAKESAKIASENYKSVTEEIKNVEDSINSLEEKTNSLKELDQGTSKWNETLNEVNDTITDLIRNYDGLKEGEHYYRDSLGALHLTEKGEEEIKEQNAEKERQILSAKNSAQFNQDQAYIYAEAEKTVRKARFEGQGIVDRDTVIKDYAKLAEAVSEGKITIEDGQFTNETAVRSLIGDYSTNVITSNTALIEQLQDLGITVQQNTEAILQSIQSELLNDPKFKEFYDSINPEYQAGVLAEAAKEILQSDKAKSFIDDKGNKITANSITDEQREAYAEANNYEYDSSKFRKKKRWSKKNEDGESETIEPVSDEAIFDWLKHNDAIEETIASQKEYNEAVKETEKFNKKIKDVKEYYENNKDALDKYIKAQKNEKEATKEQKAAWDEFTKTAQKGLAKAFSSTEAEASKLEKVFDSDFIEDHYEQIQKALGGDVEAIADLRDEAAKKIVLGLDVKTEDGYKQINKSLADLQDKLPDLEIGTKLNDSAIRPQIQNLANDIINNIKDVNKAAEVMQSLLAMEGFQNPEVEVIKLATPETKSVGHGYTEVVEEVATGGERGNIGHRKRKIKTDNLITIPGQKNYVLRVKPGKGGYSPNIKQTNVSTGGAGSNGSPSGGSDGKKGGGSNSKASKIDYTKRKDVVERYKRINDELDDTQRKYDRLNDSLDRMFGKTRVNQMNRVISTIKKENQQTAYKLKLAQNYLKIDRKQLQSALDKAQKKAGIKTRGNDFKFDSDGDIKNYYSRLDSLYEKLHAKEKKLNSITNKDKNDKYKEKYVEPLQDAIDDLKDKIEQYDETKDLIQELKNTLRENLYELQDLAYEKLTYKLEIKLEIRDNELKMLEHYFDKLSDNVYKRSEALAKIWSKTDKNMISESSKKYEVYKDFMDSITSAGTSALDVSSLEKKLHKISNYKGKTVQQVLGLTDEQMKKISQGDYAEALQKVFEDALESAEELADHDAEMLEYYADTLDMAQEKIETFTDQIDRLSTSLEHYNSVMELLGKNRDYEKINKINDALVKTSKNAYDVAKSTHDMYDGELQKAAKTLNEYEAKWKKSHADFKTEAERQAALETDAQYEILKKNYDAITEKAQESWNEQLEAAETYFEALNALTEKKLEEARWKFESAFDPKGLGFDSMLNALSGEDTWADLTLTKVNQVYEMNKLLRQVNKDIEKTDNKAAKEKYRNFTKEIDQLKQKTVLSKLDLEIAQAKYKQLQAQIALEEAQNAKSVVRLSRDNEGNYGYVYTADQDKIDDAQQALDDAENDLYNIALRGATSAQRGFIEAYQSYLSELAQAEETYKGDLAKLKDEQSRIAAKYSKIIQQYSNDYTTAITTDQRVLDEGTVNMFKSVLDQTDSWKAKSDAIIESSRDIMTDYQGKVSTVYKELGLDAKTYAATIEKVTSQSQNLADTATNSVIPALTAEADAVRKTTEEYAAQREEVLKLIEALEKLAGEAKDAKADLSGYEDNTIDKKKKTNQEAWNENIDTRVAELKEKLKKENKGRSVAVITDKNGYKHYKIYDTKAGKKAQQTAEAELRRQYENWTPEVENKNGAIMNTVSQKQEKNPNQQYYRTFDMNNGYHYAKTKKEAINNAKKADKAAGYTDEQIKKHNYKVVFYDTGGYTGEWGPGAKLAGLHEKELVLNQDDTKNFLAGISILRDIVKIIDIQAASQGGAIDSIHAASAMPFAQTLEQTVEIRAEFPNATDHSEIEQAFDSLINRAAQYANRRD